MIGRLQKAGVNDFFYIQSQRHRQMEAHTVDKICINRDKVPHKGWLAFREVDLCFSKADLHMVCALY